MLDVSAILQDPPAHPEQLSGLTLAYIGDAVFELYIRVHLLSRTKQSHALSKAAVQRVNHRVQSALFKHIEADLTDAERGVLMRGRNAKGLVPRHARVQDYRRATAIEALCGYLYLINDAARLQWVMEQVEIVLKEEEHEQS